MFSYSVLQFVNKLPPILQVLPKSKNFINSALIRNLNVILHIMRIKICYIIIKVLARIYVRYHIYDYLETILSYQTHQDENMVVMFFYNIMFSYEIFWKFWKNFINFLFLTFFLFIFLNLFFNVTHLYSTI